MDPSQTEAIQMFMSITGASEEVAVGKIQAYRGDLNAAVNSFYNEGENSVLPTQNQEPTGNIDLMEVDEPPAVQHALSPPFNPLPSAPTFDRGFRGLDTFPLGIPSRGQPIVSQPRDVREVPIEWKDEPLRARSHEGLLIEEIPETRVHAPSQSHAHFITDNEEISGSAPSRDEGERSRYSVDPFRTERLRSISNASAPSIDEIPAVVNSEGDAIEQEMLRAAIEASQKDAMGMHATEDQGGTHAEDDDLARAVSLSLKTAEREKALREGKDFSWHSNEDDYLSSEDGGHRDILKRKGSSSSAGNDYVGDLGVSTSTSLPVDRKTLSSNINYIPIIPIEDVEDDEEKPLFRKRPGRRSNPMMTQPSNTGLLESHGQAIPVEDVKQYEEQPSTRSNRRLNPNIEVPEPYEPITSTSMNPMPSESNGDAAHHDEWGVLTSEEQEEAVMLEAAIFGTLPEDAARRFRYPSIMNTVDEDGRLDEGGFHNYGRPVQQPPSPTVIAQRLLREQQDDEFLASLQADREKEVHALLEAEQRRIEEENAKAVALEAEKRREEEELHQRLAEEELKRQKAAKRAALPEEPSIDDDAAVNIMVRMPDGTRQGRRFRKSEPVQFLFNFIDAHTEVVPGSYRLVRQYPRKAFTDAEHENSLHDLGLSNNETLFLELI